MNAGWIGFSGGGGVRDHGALTGLLDDDHTQYLPTIGGRAMTGLLDADLGLDVDGALTDIGTGSYALADGDNDLGVAGDLEVDDDVQVDGEIGIKTTPSAVNLIKSTITDSVVTTAVWIDLTSIFAGVAPSAGINVLDFTLTDQLAGGARSAVIRAASMLAEYDRVAAETDANSTQRCIQVTYGIRNPLSDVTSVISSNTHNWHGLKIDATNAASGDVTGGTFTIIDLECGDAPTGFGSATFLHYAAKFNDDVWINTGWLGIGQGVPVTMLELEETITLPTGTTADAYAAAITLDPAYLKTAPASTLTRHNYIELDNPTGDASMTINDACVFRFDAAPGTHKALDAGTTKLTWTGVVDAWVLINGNGTVYFLPAFLSKTA